MTRIFILLILCFLSSSVRSQIKVREDVKLNEIDNSTFQEYDSISEFTRQEKNVDYLKYIGQTLILPPKSSNYRKGRFKFSLGIELQEDDFNKEYKIIDITSNLKSLREFPSGKNIRYIEIIIQDSIGNKITLKKDFEFADKSLHPFFIKGFYKYHENQYSGKTLFVYKESEEDHYGEPKDKYIDINTGELILLNIGDLWECQEIAFIDGKFGSVYYPYYIIKKDNKEIKVKLGELFKSGFLTLEELDIMYNYWLQEKQDIKESEEINKSILMNDCLKKFDKSKCEKLINNEVEIGMTKEMIFYSFGEPFKSFIITTENGIEEVLSYGSTILYFRNKKIFAIKQL